MSACSTTTALLARTEPRAAPWLPRLIPAGPPRAPREEFRVARAIQQQLYPTAPRLAGFDLAGASYPAEETGGDYFDFIPLPDGRVGVVIGDVSGHGFGAALLMASTRAYLRAAARTHADVSALLTTVNHFLVEDMASEHFVTLSFAVLDPHRRSLVYVNAGHPPGYVLTASGAVKAVLESTDRPLGFDPDNGFSPSSSLELAPGDLVVFLTDGITEARAPDGTLFQGGRALDVVRSHLRDGARQIVTSLYHEVNAFCQDRPPHDDLTAVVIKVAAPA